MGMSMPACITMQVHLHTSMYTHTNTHIHTHIHTHSHTRTRALQGMDTMQMVSASSHGNAMGRWYSASVVPLDPGESMEFFVHNGGSR
jgi:hypothetical protein